MRAWVGFCSGLLVWAAHFFALYAVASLLPGQGSARWLVLAVSLAALAGLGFLGRAGLRRRSGSLDGFGRWLTDLGLLGIALSAVATTYQASIALF
jgi:hypothetical protein